MLPENLVLVRHGESEFNKLVHELRQTNRDFNTLDPSVLNKTGSKWRLTKLGLQQAAITGDYIRNNMKIKFDGFFVSDYVRAKETAAALQLKDAHWKVEPYLRERDWGDVGLRDFVERTGSSTFREEDPFYGAPPNGESISNLCLRVDRVLDTLHREYPGKSVIIVCHGELMWAFRVRLERLLEDDFIRLDKSKNPHDRIHNAQILHYKSGRQVRSICPPDKTLSSNGWKEIYRKQFSNQDLLNDVEQYPHVILNV